MAYEHHPGEFIVLDRFDLEELHSATDHAIAIDKFVSPDEIDAIYFAGKTYYLLPNGQPAREIYPVLRQAMKDEGVWGIARMFLHRRDRLMVVRPLERSLSISRLYYADAIRPAAQFDLSPCSGQSAALKLAQMRTLIGKNRVEHAGLKEYYDPYHEHLAALIEAKTGAAAIRAQGAGQRQAVGNGINARRSSEVQPTHQPARCTTMYGERIRSQRPLRRPNG
jgi:DNA end-binding protein Ku